MRRLATPSVVNRTRGVPVTAGLFVLLVVLVFFDPVFFRRNFAGRDLLAYNLPNEKAVHDAYARGRLPVWISEVSGGRPLLANPNVGAFYPVRPLLSPLPFPVAMRLFPVLHWALAGVGMILLLCALGASLPGAWLGAVTYVFSGVGISEVFYPHNQPGVALLPWIVWATLRAVGSERGGMLLLALLLGLDLLAGDIFTVGLAVLATLLWIAVEMPSGLRLRALRRVAVAGGLAVLLALPQIVASAFWIPLTNRAVLGMKLEESFFYSISPWRLLEFVIPFPFGATWDLSLMSWAPGLFLGKRIGLFTTLYAGALAPICLVSTRRSRAPGLRFGRIFFAIGLALSVLPALVPAGWRNSASPLPLRNPEKLVFACILGLAIAAGRGLDHLRKDGETGRWILSVGSVLAGLALVASLRPDTFAGIVTQAIGAAEGREAAARQIPGALAEGAFLWTATWVAIGLREARAHVLSFVAVVVLTVLPILATRRIPLCFPEEILAPTPFARLQQKRDPMGWYRALGESPFTGPPTSASVPRIEIFPRDWSCNAHALWGRGTVLNGDFDVGDLSRTESLRRLASVASRFRDSSPFFSALALKWGIRYRDEAPLSGYSRFGGDPVQDWDRNDQAQPDIRLATVYRSASGPVEALRLLPRLKESELVIESGESGIGFAKQGTVHILERSPERLRLSLRALDPGWLFVLRDYWPYRRVRVDGIAVDVFPAQLAFSAVRIPVGIHRVDWTEQAPGWPASLLGPFLFLVCGPVVLLRERASSARGERL